MTIDEKTKRVIEILVDTYRVQSASRRPFIQGVVDRKTGKPKVINYTGDFEEVKEWYIATEKFTDERVYIDEAYGILAELGKKYNFTYASNFFSSRQSDYIKIEKPTNVKWADIINQLQKTVRKISTTEPEEEGLKSIHLITNSLEPTTVIFLVLDERFEMPIRFAVKNKNGNPTYIKKLYDIAYFVDAPNKKVNYDMNVADGINNGLFRKGAVAKYMKTNKLKKPTLVQKSENKTLVLKNEILAKTGRVQHDVPTQYQSLYIDKTK